jgi:chemotaxis protein histidine kinase CheA
MVILTTRQDLELHNLRLAFLALLPERVQAIEAALNDVLDADGADPERLEILFHLAHRLCGSAGIYGQQAVHRAAGALECAAEAVQRTGAHCSSGQRAALRRLVLALRRASRTQPRARATAPKKPTAPKRRRTSR